MVSSIDRIARSEQSSRALRIFQRALLVVSVVLAFTPVSSFAQNLILNPGFETNACGTPPGQCFVSPPGWTLSGAVDITSTGYGNGSGHNGPWALNPFGAGSTTTQTVAIANAGLYRFSFYYSIPYAPVAPLTVTVGGTTVFNATVSNTSYLQSISTLFLPAGPTNVQFTSGTGGYELNIDDVSLTALALSIGLPTNAPINPTNVAAAIDAFTNGGGTLPAGFQNLFSLTPNQLVAALNQLSGEAATGAQTGAFELMNSFLGLMVDQSLDAGNGNSVGLASGFAPERQALPADVALAYASMLKAPPARSSQPWSAWGSAYGGTNNATGDAAVMGSHDVRTNTWGIAAGLDYRLSPDTKIGFALGGAGTNWGLSDGLGGGKSDAFQAGIYGLTRSARLISPVRLPFLRTGYRPTVLPSPATSSRPI